MEEKLKIDDFSDEVLLILISNFPFETLINIVQATRRFRQIAYDDKIWTPLISNDFSPEEQRLIQAEPKQLKKESYARLLLRRLGDQEQEILRLHYLLHDYDNYTDLIETKVPLDDLWLLDRDPFDHKDFHDEFQTLMANAKEEEKRLYQAIIIRSKIFIEQLSDARALYLDRESLLNEINDLIMGEIISNVLDDENGSKVGARGIITRLTSKSVDRLFEELPDLITLDLSCNGLTVLPENISDLVSLTLLNLSHNHLSFLPKALPQLWTLNIGSNQFQGIPAIVFDQSRLRSLIFGNYVPTGRSCVCCDGVGQRISGNELKVIPEEITRLTKLIFLNISSVGLNTLSPLLADLVNLNRVIARHNNISIVPDVLQAKREQSNEANDPPQLEIFLHYNPIGLNPLSSDSDLNLRIRFLLNRDLAFYTIRSLYHLIDFLSELFSPGPYRASIPLRLTGLLMIYFGMTDENNTGMALILSGLLFLLLPSSITKAPLQALLGEKTASSPHLNTPVGSLNRFRLYQPAKPILAKEITELESDHDKKPLEKEF